MARECVAPRERSGRAPRLSGGSDAAGDPDRGLAHPGRRAGCRGSVIRDQCQHATSLPAVLPDQGKSPGSGPERWPHGRTGRIPGLASRTRCEGRSAVAAGAGRAALPGAAPYGSQILAAGPGPGPAPAMPPRACRTSLTGPHRPRDHVACPYPQTARDHPVTAYPARLVSPGGAGAAPPHRGRGLTRFTVRAV
jgi:hypothetical protein